MVAFLTVLLFLTWIMVILGTNDFIAFYLFRTSFKHDWGWFGLLLWGYTIWGFYCLIKAL